MYILHYVYIYIHRSLKGFVKHVLLMSCPLLACLVQYDSINTKNIFLINPGPSERPSKEFSNPLAVIYLYASILSHMYTYIYIFRNLCPTNIVHYQIMSFITVCVYIYMHAYNLLYTYIYIVEFRVYYYYLHTMVL